MKPIENGYTKPGEEEDVINLREIIELVLHNWYWFVLSIIVCVGMAFLYLAMVSPTYQRNAVMLIKSDKKTSADPTAITLLELSGGLSGGGVENEMYILSSHQLVKEVVKRLNLDVTYEVRKGLKKVQLYNERPITVLFQASFNDLPFKLEIIPLSNAKYKIVECTYYSKKESETVKVNKEYDYGKSVETPLGYITVTPDLDNVEEHIGKSVYVTRVSLNKATDAYRESVKTSLIAKQSTLIKIECADTNVPRADAILNKIVEVYNETIIEDKNRIASNTARFIDERIRHISEELGDVEDELTTFKQKNKLVNIDANSKIYLEETSKAKEENTKLEADLYVAKAISRDLSDANRRNQLIANLGVGDANLQQQIATYNEMLLQRNRLVTNSGEANPVVVDLDTNLAGWRETISGAINNLINVLELKLKKARDVEGRMQYNIQSVPEQEKTVINITRQQAIKSSLYTFLLNKREETSLQLAVTEADIRVVEAPFGSDIPVAPRRMIILFIALVFGFALPLGLYIVYFLWDTTVHGRKDVEKYTSLPILGEIPPRRKEYSDGDIVVSEENNNRITEAFRLLRTNLDFIAKDVHMLVFTSTLAGEGKTFISRNLAVTFAFSGKRVVLVDTDLRKRTQSKISGTTNKAGLSTYLSGQSSNVKELVVAGALHPMVDMIPAGPMPPNPSELLMSNRLEQLVLDLKQHYDYIIFDNIPALVVADAVIINRVADLTIYVIRDGVLDRRYLPELEKLHRESKFKNMCAVINDSKVENKYGYGYGYGEYYHTRHSNKLFKSLFKKKKN